MHHLQDAIVALIHHYGYFGLFGALALGNIGAPVGAEILMTVAGGLVATGHLSSLWLTIAVGVLGELTGGSIGYAAGKYGGRTLVDRWGKYLHLTHDNLDRVHAFFERYGSFSIFICRFIPMIRGIVSIPAGIAEMSLAPFYLWYAFGSLIFCGGLALLGDALGRDIDKILPLLHRGGLIIFALVLLVAIIAILVTMTRPKTKTTLE